MAAASLYCPNFRTVPRPHSGNSGERSGGVTRTGASGSERGCEATLTPSRSDRSSSPAGGWHARSPVGLRFVCTLAGSLASGPDRRNGERAFSSRDDGDVVAQLKPTQLAADECSGVQASPIGTSQLPRPFEKLASHL